MSLRPVQLVDRDIPMPMGTAPDVIVANRMELLSNLNANILYCFRLKARNRNFQLVQACLELKKEVGARGVGSCLLANSSFHLCDGQSCSGDIELRGVAHLDNKVSSDELRVRFFLTEDGVYKISAKKSNPAPWDKNVIGRALWWDNWRVQGQLSQDAWINSVAAAHDHTPVLTPC